MIPKDISESIINRYKNYKVNNRSQLLQYFIDNKLKALIENINDFQESYYLYYYLFKIITYIIL